jgi:hypothetical protein
MARPIYQNPFVILTKGQNLRICLCSAAAAGYPIHDSFIVMSGIRYFVSGGTGYAGGAPGSVITRCSNTTPGSR